MRRRTFVASGVGLMAAAASQGLVGTLTGLHAQPAVPAVPAGPRRGKWVRLAAIPQANGELLGVAIDGRLYASEGLLPGFKPAGLVYEYDTVRDAWAQKKPMPHPVHHAAVAALNGKMFLFGGFDLPTSGPPGWNPVNEAWEYAPATDSWRALAPMPTARGGSVAAVVGGKFYVIGGAGPMPEPGTPTIRPRQPQRSLGNVEEYDPATNKWRARAPMPTPCNHMGGEAANGRIYVIGGRLSGGFIIGFPGNINLGAGYEPAAGSLGNNKPKPNPARGVNSPSFK